MNIELQCCALFIIFAIAVMFIREKKLDLMNRKLFQRAILACFACLIFDILSVILINLSVHSGFSVALTEMVCKFYIMLLVLQGYFGYVYASTSLLPGDKMWAVIVKYMSHLIFVVGEMMMLILPIGFTAEGRVVYSFGPSTSVAYVLSAIYILSTIITTIAYRKHMPGRRFIAMLLWQGLWLLAAAIQFAQPQLLLVGFASSFGMVILYIQLENPSEYIDASTGLFTMNALSAYVHDRYKYDKSFSLFTAQIHYLTNYVDYNMEQAAVMRTAKALVALGPEPAFRIDDDTFCVVYDVKERMIDKAANIKRQKDGVTDLPAKGTYLLIPDSSIMSGPDEFFRFLHNYLETEQEITIADEKLVQKLRDQNRIKELIDEALRTDRVEVFYQPFYNVKGFCFDVAEALVRIRTEDGDIVPPGEFIPIAEETGQIIPLGIRVFEKVCAFLAKGEAIRYGLKQVEVNISAAQFDYDNPAKFVKQILDEYNVDPSCINLEITETAAAKNRDFMLKNMNRLIEKGIDFSLDDFGTGRSNIDYFVNMPVKNIKFDYTFTRGFFENDKTKYVLSGMMDILHKLDMNIVAEGIETEEQMKVMTELGIEFIQGYYFSRPIPEPEFIAFLKEKNGRSE
ncbi:EAL domain, c-di-GMP-specific phosphodiesterase class I (or its enzymatically inactive variant) [Lachnospiraceae bacterium XBB2008]|nr:EAL domain, c-di-GMP-specific phosphodiesterase class I (or its enzymatically inactive variant) [Lachnospiraceae bacterium XBB2008]